MTDPEDTRTLPLPLPLLPRNLGPVHQAVDDAAEADLPVPAPEPWRLALLGAVVADPRGRQGVAETLDVSRGYVSRVVGGDLSANPPARFIARVEATLMALDCPYLGCTLPPAQCRGYAQRSYAQIGAGEGGHWRACRKCAHNPARPAPKPGSLAPQAADSDGQPDRHTDSPEAQP